MGAHAVAAQPACRRQLQHTLEAAIIGEQQQALGVDIQAAYSDHARQAVRFKMFKDGLAALWVLLCDHQTSRLVVEPYASALTRRQWSAVDHDLVTIGYIEGGSHYLLAVDHNAAFGDPHLGVSTRAKPGAGDNLGETIAGIRFGGGGVVQFAHFCGLSCHA